MQDELKGWHGQKTAYLPTAPVQSASMWEIEVHVELAKAKDLREFIQKITKIVRSFGFSDFSFVRMQQMRQPELSLWTTPAEIPQYYADEEIWQHDFMLQYAVENTRPIYQSVIDTYIDTAPFETITIKKNKQIQAFVKEIGFLDYYNIPIRSANRNGNVLLSVTTRFMDSLRFRCQVQKVKDKLESLCRAIDAVGISRFPESFLNSSESATLFMGAKPLLLLRLIGNEDLTLTQAAEKMNISLKTANKHIANAREALGARTTQGAVAKAWKLGLLGRE